MKLVLKKKVRIVLFKKAPEIDDDTILETISGRCAGQTTTRALAKALRVPPEAVIPAMNRLYTQGYFDTEWVISKLDHVCQELSYRLRPEPTGDWRRAKQKKETND